METSLSEQKEICFKLDRISSVAKKARRYAKDYRPDHMFDVQPMYAHFFNKFLKLASKFTEVKTEYENKYGSFCVNISSYEAQKIYARKKAAKAIDERKAREHHYYQEHIRNTRGETDFKIIGITGHFHD